VAFASESIKKSVCFTWVRNTHDANKKLTVKFNNTVITHVDHSKYLGLTLDRTLIYKPHLETTAMKVNSRVNLVQRLAGTKWGSDALHMHIQYCALFWLNSVHVNKIDVQPNNAMRLNHRHGEINSTPMAA
jgi:hypothetical protein